MFTRFWPCSAGQFFSRHLFHICHLNENHINMLTCSYSCRIGLITKTTLSIAWNHEPHGIITNIKWQADMCNVCFKQNSQPIQQCCHFFRCFLADSECDIVLSQNCNDISVRVGDRLALYYCFFIPVSLSVKKKSLTV